MLRNLGIIDRSSRTQSGTSTIRNVQTQLGFDFKTDVLVDSIIGGQLNMTKLNLSFDTTLPELHYSWRGTKCR